MTTNLASYDISPRVTSKIIEARGRIPMSILRAVRAADAVTDLETVYSMLDSIGPSVIYGLVCEGMMTTDIADSLDVPPLMFEKWLRTQNAEDFQISMEISAERMMSKTLKMLDNVGDGDVDAIRVAKIKADFNDKFMKSRNPERYTDKSKQNNVDAEVRFNIMIGGHGDSAIQKKVIDL